MGPDYVYTESGEKVRLVPVCPMCRAHIRWTLYGGRKGAQAPATCANNIEATRIFTKLSELITCDWEGIVERNKDGSVKIFNKDGTKIPKQAIKVKNNGL